MKSKGRKRQSKVSRAIKLALKNPFTIAYIAIVVVVFVTTIIVFKTETKTGSGITTKFDSFWFMCVAVFAAYFEFVCESLPGRAAALTMLITGTVLFSYIRGQVTSVFMDSQMKKDRGLKKLKDMEGHFVICGWKPGFDKILDTVFASNPEIEANSVVVINENPDQMESLRSESRFKEINYVAGDFTDEVVLRRAFIEKASRALVLSDKSKNYSNLEIDSRTVLAVLTIENMSRGIYVVAELLSGKFEKHLQMAHCDEIILTQDYEYSLLATASSGMGYSNVIRSLISDDADTGVLIFDIPKEFIGKTYKEFKAASWAKMKERGILVGLLLNTGNFHKRRKEALREAQKNPNINNVIENLQKIKTLKSNNPILVPSPDTVISKNTKAIYVKG